MSARRLREGVLLERLGTFERWLIPGAWPDPGERCLEVEQAVALVRRVTVVDAGAQARIQAMLARASWVGVGVGAFGRAVIEQRAELEGRLRRRELSVVERERPALGRVDGPSLGERPRGEDAPLEPLAQIIDEGPASQLLVSLRVRVIEDDASPVAGLGLSLAAPDGPREASTPAGGALEFAELQPGPATLRLGSVAGLRWSAGERPSAEPLVGRDERGVALRVDLRELLEFEAELDTAIATCVVLERPRLRFVVPECLRCDHESALLVPASWTGDRHPLAALVHGLVALLDEPDRWLAIVGHASAPGSDATNQAISEARADALRAIVDDDEAGWVAHARERGSLRDVLAYLDYLGRRRGWTCAVEPERGVAEHGTSASEASRAAVSAFQADYNGRFAGESGDELRVDGVCGERTLAALFRVLRDEFERWLAKLGATPDQLPRERVVYLGYGSTLAGRAGEAAAGEEPDEDPDAADRRVDVIVIEALAFDEAIGAAQLYTSETARRGRYELPHEPDEWAAGPFTIVSDLTPDEPAEPETYELRATDGSWAVERVLPEQGEVEAGELVLRFSSLPTELRYSLTVISSTGKRSVIFEDLAYGELHGRAPKLG